MLNKKIIAKVFLIPWYLTKNKKNGYIRYSCASNAMLQKLGLIVKKVESKKLWVNKIWERRFLNP